MSQGFSTKQLIREYAWDLGIDGIGSCDAEPLLETREVMESAVSRGLIPEESAPRPGTIIRLTTPRRHLKGARSILSAFEYYHRGDARDADPAQGKIAAYTRANHYLDLKLKLQMLAGFMEREFDCRTKVFSCYVTLAEKPLAGKAGIGFYGKHGVIVTPAHGSYVVLGELLTDLDLEPDRARDIRCGSCTTCMDACPTGAIPEPYMVDRGRCIQYLSQRRADIPQEIRKIWADRLYGCTTCQDVCPHNAGLRHPPRKVIFGWIGDSIPLGEILDMDDEGFRIRFRNNQISIRDPAVIRRNAIIAAGNSRLGRFMAPLKRLAGDPDPMIRQYSLWAIARIGGPSVRGLLEKALAADTDPDVRRDIKTLLDGPTPFA